MAIRTEDVEILVRAITESAIKELQKAEKGVENLDNATKKSDDNQNKFTATIKDAKFEFLAYTQIIKQVAEVAKQAFDMAEEGAQIQRMEEASHNLARSMGADMDLIITKLKEASKGTVEEMSLMQSASKALSLGVTTDADKLAQLYEVAAVRAKAMGTTTTQAFDDIVIAIGRESKQIFDNLGIVYKANEVLDDYAKTIGKTASELSTAERKEALTSMAIEKTTDLIAAQGDSLMDNADQWAKWKANTKDTMNDVKKVFSDALTPIIRYSNLVSDMRKAMEAGIITQKEFRGIVNQTRYTEESLIESENKLQNAIDEHAVAVKNNIGQYIEYSSVQNDAEWSARAQTQANYEIALSFDAVSASIGSSGLTGQQEKYRKSNDDILFQMDALLVERQKNVMWYGEESTKVQEVDEKIGELITKQDDLRRQYEETTAQIIYQSIVKSLDGDAALQLARELGLLDEKQYAMLGTLDMLKEKFDEDADGMINGREAASGYATEVGLLRDAMELLGDKEINPKVIMSFVARTSAEAQRWQGMYDQWAETQPNAGGATGLSMDVPQGYPNDTFLIGATSDEHVEVTPPGKTNSMADLLAEIRGLRSDILLSSSSGFSEKKFARAIRDVVEELR